MTLSATAPDTIVAVDTANYIATQIKVGAGRAASMQYSGIVAAWRSLSAAPKYASPGDQEHQASRDAVEYLCM